MIPRRFFLGLALLAVLPARAETASPEIERVYLSQGVGLGFALSPNPDRSPLSSTTERAGGNAA